MSIDEFGQFKRSGKFKKRQAGRDNTTSYSSNDTNPNLFYVAIDSTKQYFRPRNLFEIFRLVLFILYSLLLLYIIADIWIDTVSNLDVWIESISISDVLNLILCIILIPIILLFGFVYWWLAVVVIRAIVTYPIFRPRNRLEIYQLICFVVYVCAILILLYHLVDAYHEDFFEKLISMDSTDSHAIFYMLCCVIPIIIALYLGILLIPISFCWLSIAWLLRSINNCITQHVEYIVTFIYSFILLICFGTPIGLAVYFSIPFTKDSPFGNLMSQQTPETLVAIDSMWMYCYSPRDIYQNPNNSWVKEKLKRNTKVLVVGATTYKYKILYADKIGYVDKLALGSFVDTLHTNTQLEKRRNYAKDYYAVVKYATNYSNCSVEEEYFNNDAYRGQIDKNKERSGSGTYLWRNKFSLVDSCYIGYWEKDMRQGYGIFCDFTNQQCKSGIWAENELIQHGGNIDTKDLQIKIDSVFTYCKQGLQQLKMD